MLELKHFVKLYVEFYVEFDSLEEIQAFAIGYDAGYRAHSDLLGDVT